MHYSIGKPRSQALHFDLSTRVKPGNELSIGTYVAVQVEYKHSDGMPCRLSSVRSSVTVVRMRLNFSTSLHQGLLQFNPIPTTVTEKRVFVGKTIADRTMFICTGDWHV